MVFKEKKNRNNDYYITIHMLLVIILNRYNKCLILTYVIVKGTEVYCSYILVKYLK